MILIFLGEDFFGFYYFYNKVRERTQNEWQKRWFLGNYLPVSELFRNFVAVKFKNYRAYKAYWTPYSAVFHRISVPNYWHNNGTEHCNSLVLSMCFKLQWGWILGQHFPYNSLKINNVCRCELFAHFIFVPFGAFSVKYVANIKRYKKWKNNVSFVIFLYLCTQFHQWLENE